MKESTQKETNARIEDQPQEIPAGTQKAFSSPDIVILPDTLTSVCAQAFEYCIKDQ